jgi:hypothetical protein
MLYSFFWVIPQCLNLCVNVSEHSVLSIFVGGIRSLHHLCRCNRHCSEMSKHKFRRWGITQQKDYNFMKLAFSSQTFETYSTIKSHEIPSSGSRVFHVDGQTDRQMRRWTDTTKLRVAFCNFVNKPKNPQHFAGWICLYVKVEHGKGKPTACPAFLTNQGSLPFPHYT